MTFWEAVESGEYVLIALAVIFIISICIWWVRGARLRKDQKSYDGMMQRVRDHVVEGDIETARQICSVVSTPGANIVVWGLDHVGQPMERLEQGLREEVRIEKSGMTKGLRWLRAISVVSPLLGLGGTLTGMIHHLRDLGESGSQVSLAMICDSLAPTIITTVAGLGVGIFSLIAFTCLESAVETAGRKLDETAGEFIRLLDEPAS